MVIKPQHELKVNMSKTDQTVFKQEEQAENYKWPRETAVIKVIGKRTWMCLILAVYLTSGPEAAGRTENSSLPSSAPARAPREATGMRN